jgi:hypothetical protein
MEHEGSEPDDDDPASRAFAKLRREVAMMRLAVEKLADEPAKIDIPDYTETLTEIREATRALASRYRDLCDLPALSVTPDQLAAQINAAAKEARNAERLSLQNAQNSFAAITRELMGFVESARSADRQNKWVVGAFLLGIAICAAFVMLATGWNTTELPERSEVRQVVQKPR